MSSTGHGVVLTAQGEAGGTAVLHDGGSHISLTGDALTAPPYRVLIVDEDAKVRSLLAEKLLEAGMSSIEVDDGLAALDTIAKVRVDALLVDLNASRVDGLDLMGAIRADAATRNLPVLVLADDSNPDQCVASLGAGAADYIVKPLHPDEVLARLRVHLRIAREWDRTARARLEQRNALGRALARVRDGADAVTMVRALCSEVAALHAGSATVMFGEEASVVLAADGLDRWNISVGQSLPPWLAAALREQASRGPWLEYAPASFAAIGIADAPCPLACAPLVGPTGARGVFLIGVKQGGRASGSGEELTDGLGEAIDHARALNGLLGPELERWVSHRDQTDDIARVILQGAFSPAFQPITRLTDGHVVGHEALTRFHDGSSPEARFRQAATLGAGGELEAATFAAAIRAAERLSDGGFLSLNISPSFLSDFERVRECLRASGKPVVLELTEHDPIDDYPLIRRALTKLRPLTRLSIDDAGSGFASLRHVIELRPEYVKLDRLWIDSIDTDPTRQALVAGLHHFAESTGSQLIAEGIERPEELVALSELGIELGQGYLLGRPA